MLSCILLLVQYVSQHVMRSDAGLLEPLSPFTSEDSTVSRRVVDVQIHSSLQVHVDGEKETEEHPRPDPHLQSQTNAHAPIKEIPKAEGELIYILKSS